MDFLPVFLDIKNKPCLVVGGGPIAARKVRLLIKAGGLVSVVAPTLCKELAGQLEKELIEHRAREFKDDDLAEQVLVIAATDIADVNHRVSTLAKQQRLPVNVVDEPDLCGFIMPSIIDRSPIQIAVSTGGASPVLARLVRAHLESYVPAAYGQLASLVDGYRDQVKQRFPDVDQRRFFWSGCYRAR